MAIRKSLLPSAYQQVEYIESSGTQYIDTQFNPQNGFKIQASIIITSLASRSTLFGFNGNSQESFLRINANGSATFWANTVGGSVPNLTFSANTKYNIECYFNSSAYIKVDGTTIQTLTTTNSYYNGSMPLLCCGNIGSSNTDYGYFQLFSCCIYDSANVLVRNYIPCYRKADDVIGLYDTVNGVFYTNAGSGTFTKGNDVMPKVKKLIKNNDYVIRAYKGSSLYYNALPSEFKAVEYIESSGTQYIDTGIVSSTDVGTHIKFEYIQFNNKYNRLFGTSGTGGSQYGCRSSTTSGGNLYGELPDGSSITTSSPSITLSTNTLYNLDFNNIVNATHQIMLNENSYLFGTVIKTTGSQNIWLFGHNPSNSALSSFKLYVCKIYDNDKLVRYFIPCYRVSDTTIGLYDLVNGVFYTNAGTGTFTKGSDI